MADVTVHVLTPATTTDLVTLDECKLLSGILLTDTSQDAYLTMQISIQSDIVALMCNRVFAREEVEESWRQMQVDPEIGGPRLFLTHWPVAAADIETVLMNETELTPDLWDLEERTGKLSNYVGWGEPAVVTYTGGYILPDDAPLPLKHATALLVNEARRQQQRESIEGIRSLSHKHARVQFFDPNALLLKTISTGGQTAVQLSVSRLLAKYMQTNA
jgi:hypothetical protein